MKKSYCYDCDTFTQAGSLQNSFTSFLEVRENAADPAQERFSAFAKAYASAVESYILETGELPGKIAIKLVNQGHEGGERLPVEIGTLAEIVQDLEATKPGK